MLTDLNLKELSYTTVRFLSLLTGQRCHTIHKLDICYTEICPDIVQITILQLLKTTKRGRHQQSLEILAYPLDSSLCILNCLGECMMRTSLVRKDNNKFLLGIRAPHDAVSKASFV